MWLYLRGKASKYCVCTLEFSYQPFSCNSHKKCHNGRVLGKHDHHYTPLSTILDTEPLCRDAHTQRNTYVCNRAVVHRERNRKQTLDLADKRLFFRNRKEESCKPWLHISSFCSPQNKHRSKCVHIPKLCCTSQYSLMGCLSYDIEAFFDVHTQAQLQFQCYIDRGPCIS